MASTPRLFIACILGLVASCGASNKSPGADAPAGMQPAGNANTPTSGAAGGTATISGTVSGIAFMPKAAVYAMGSVQGTDLLLLDLSEQADACARLAQHVATKNTGSAVAVMLNLQADGSSLPPTPGTYPIGSAAATPTGLSGEMQFDALDASCKPRIADAAGVVKSGSVVITSPSIDGSAPLKGTFDLVVGTQNDKVRGTFEAVACPALLQAATDSSAKACK